VVPMEIDTEKAQQKQEQVGIGYAVLCGLGREATKFPTAREEFPQGTPLFVRQYGGETRRSLE